MVLMKICVTPLLIFCCLKLIMRYEGKLSDFSQQIVVWSSPSPQFQDKNSFTLFSNKSIFFIFSFSQFDKRELFDFSVTILVNFAKNF